MRAYKLLCFVIVVFFGCEVFAKDFYYVAKRSFNYKEQITKADLKIYDGAPPTICVPFGLGIFNTKDHLIVTSHYIVRGKLICQKDIKKIKIEYVSANFGAISIKRQGKVIMENKDYIKIKTLQGESFKIYKHNTNKIR